MGGYVPLVISGKSYSLCHDCYRKKTKLSSNDVNSKNDALSFFKKMNSEGKCAKDIYGAIVGGFEREQAAKEREQALEIKRKENELLIQEKRKDFMYTTGVGFEGYRIKRYIKLVSGETVNVLTCKPIYS